MGVNRSKTRFDGLAAGAEALYGHDIAVAREGSARVAGIDEAGRGPLAGPVAAAAVILDLDNPIDGVDDSKKLTAARRDELYDAIVSSGCAYGVGLSTAREIDDMNILQATFLAMRRALAALCGGKIPLASRGLLLVDGNQYIAGVPRGIQKPIVGGDAKSASIAAASILAKVTRDRVMEDYHREYPQYGFAKHKGYGTKYHREMIAQYGLSPIHRRTFCGNVIQTTLFERC